jgi:putative phosphonate catabolism associated alcohol dehydrogenase
MIPTTSQAAIFIGPNQPMQLRALPIPELQSHEALVAIECTTICGSDLHTCKGVRKERCPSILGHESIGFIVAVGNPPLADVDGVALRIGQRVTWSTSVSCGECDRCQIGLPQKCRTLIKYGHEVAEGRAALCGGLAEYMLLRSGSAVVHVDLELAAEVACPANCATATVACAMRYAQPVAGARVLIFGAGMLGLTAAAMAKSMLASDVTVVDTLPARLEIACRFGADRVVHWKPDPENFSESLSRACGYDQFGAVFEFSGSSEAVAAACRACDVGGRVILVGTVMPSPIVDLDPEMVVRRCMSIRGVHNYASEDLVAAIRFLSGVGACYPFAELVKRMFQLTEINQAITYALEHRPVRIAIRP